MEKIANGEELDEGDVNPIIFGSFPSDQFQCELTGNLSRLAFATADDPFFKQPVGRFYPEAIVYDKNGNLLARVGPESRSDNVALTYSEDFRDKKLKLNDDRKIQI